MTPQQIAKLTAPFPPEALEEIAALEGEIKRLTAANAGMREALEKICNHWANSYDHPHANTGMYRGPYGIGIVDGHRACTIIARKALARKP